MRRASAAVCVTTALVASVVLAAPARAATAVVPIGDNWFGHDSGGHADGMATHEVRVRAGSLVRWIWVGTGRHNVTVKSGPERFHSPTQTAGSYARRLRKGGRYRLVCTIHARDGQTMILRVR